MTGHPDFTGPEPPPPSPLADVVETFRRWLYLPDPGGVYTVLGAVVANRTQGDAVWLLHVAPPGGGKTEVIFSISGLPEVRLAATLTEASLLSGSPKREKASDATGGLLRSIGEYGIIVAKDFTSVLSMATASRGEVLAALREIYDGSWTRHVGTDGGRTLSWSGKVGFIGGCTPTIDRHQAVMGAMGERFVLYRLPVADGDELAERSLAHVGREAEMRQELQDAVAAFIESVRPVRPELSADEKRRLVMLAGVAARCRSATERDAYSREIVLIPDAEVPTGLVTVLARMYGAMLAIGLDPCEAWRVTAKLGLDSIPAVRRSMLDLLLANGVLTTPDAATLAGYPTQTARRALEDLAAHHVVTRSKNNTADEWRLAEPWRTRYAATVPETLSLSITPVTMLDRKSGTVEPDPGGGE